MKNKGLLTGFIVFVLILVVSAGCICFALKNTSAASFTTSIKSSDIVSRQRSEYIAALYIEGEIGDSSRTYNQEWLLKTIEQLTQDTKNVAIALSINSPGGSVYQTDEVYLALKDYTKSGRKIYVYQSELAASGGYYISCAGSKIYANRNTLTGSIGVIAGQTMEVTGLFEKLGIKSETIHAGKNKNMGNYNEPLSDEQRAILQSVADECYEQFTAIVSNSRKIDLDKVQQIADGRIYTAKQALELKLVDKIDTWDNMLADLKKNELGGEEYRIVEFKVPQSSSLLNYISSVKSSIEDAKTAQALGLPLKAVQMLNSNRKYPAFIYEN